MPWSGGVFTRTNGVFTGSTVWGQDAAAGTLITSSHHDTHDQDIANGLNNCVTKDGTNSFTILSVIATADPSTGVINIGGVNFANMISGSIAGNCFLGNSGNFTVTGQGNVGIGYGAFVSGVGAIPLGALTTGSSNIAFGPGAGGALTTGTSNLAIGANSMKVATTSGNNICLGPGSGQTLTTGSSNIFFGFGPTVTTGSRNLVIGNANDVVNPASSGQMNIFCTIFGTGCTTTGTSPGNGKIGINNNTPTYTLDLGSGDMGIATAGNTLRIAEGSNAKMGISTLVGGTVVVSNTSVTANSRIFLTCQTPGGTPGFLRVSARTAGTSFTILSSSGTDTSIVAWLIHEPY